MHNNDPHITLEQKLQPPAEAKTSVILNSVGNGVMLGTAPFVISKTAEGIFKSWHTPKALHYFDAFALIAGTIWGLTNGAKEFRRLQDYRQTVSNEILRMNAEMEEDRGQVKSWAEKVKKPEASEQVDAQISR